MSCGISNQTIVLGYPVLGRAIGSVFLFVGMAFMGGLAWVVIRICLVITFVARGGAMSKEAVFTMKLEPELMREFVQR